MAQRNDGGYDSSRSTRSVPNAPTYTKLRKKKRSGRQKRRMVGARPYKQPRDDEYTMKRMGGSGTNNMNKKPIRPPPPSAAQQEEQEPMFGEIRHCVTYRSHGFIC
eukprot:82997_1